MMRIFLVGETPPPPTPPSSFFHQPLPPPSLPVDGFTGSVLSVSRRQLICFVAVHSHLKWESPPSPLPLPPRIVSIQFDFKNSINSFMMRWVMVEPPSTRLEMELK